MHLESRSQRPRYSWSAPRNQDLWVIGSWASISHSGYSLWPLVRRTFTGSVSSRTSCGWPCLAENPGSGDKMMQLLFGYHAVRFISAKDITCLCLFNTVLNPPPMSNAAGKENNHVAFRVQNDARIIKYEEFLYITRYIVSVSTNRQSTFISPHIVNTRSSSKEIFSMNTSQLHWKFISNNRTNNSYCYNWRLFHFFSKTT